jgi:hypothetical protein
MAFDTYVRIKQVRINFVAGIGLEVPPVTLSVVLPSQRTGTLVTLRNSVDIGQSTLTARGSNIPNSARFRTVDIQNGEVLFPVDVFPSYTDVPFWLQFGQEFHLTFGARTGDYSLGIASIDVIADAFLRNTQVIEGIYTFERKYYASTGSLPGGNNPDSYLGEADSATAYWRTATTVSTQGANRNRAYSFGSKLTQDGALQRGDPQGLELLQEEKYNQARDLFSHPYTWLFDSFIPLDEAEALTFYGGSLPEWSLFMSLEVGALNEVNQHDTNTLIFGEIPNRTPWNAPGHAWTWTMEESYERCIRGGPYEMVVNYNFAHLHDGLAIVETARFWDELPTGFTRLIRSTMYSPDPTFGQSNESGVGITGGSTTRPVLVDTGLFFDSQGNPIDPDLILNAGKYKDPQSGEFVVLETGGE